MKFYAKTHIGNIRKVNEDCFYAPSDKEGFFAVVADGMGGHNAGEVASKMIVDSVIQALCDVQAKNVTPELLKDVLTGANKKVWEDSLANPTRRGMGSTVTLAVFQGDQAIIAHVGDSRAYQFRNSVLTQITKDHSYVQLLVDKGFITKEQIKDHPQKNIITRAIGTEAEIEIDTYTIDMQKGDCILLCTDGLNTNVLDEEIEKILTDAIPAATHQLIDAALFGGGTDNVTVVIVQTGGDAI